MVFATCCWDLSDFTTLAALLIAVMLLLYNFSTKTFSHWNRFNIKFAKPVPFFGNSMSTIFKRKSLAQNQKEIYNLFPNEDFVGMFLFRIPILMVRNPNVIVRILTKDFVSFQDRGISIDEKLDLLSLHLVNLKGQRWKSLRNKLTPAFSSGNLRNMCIQLEDCTLSLEQHMRNSLKMKSSQNVLDIMKEFATDVIGCCVFGLNMKLLEVSECNFRKMGQAIFKPSPRIVMKFLARAVHPKLPYYLGLKFLDKNVEAFFLHFVKNKLLEIGKQTNTDDGNKNFINLLMDLKTKGKDSGSVEGSMEKNKFVLDDQTIASNVFAFFLAGFETVSSTMSFFLFELAANKHIQDTVRNEILKTLDSHGGEINYDTIKDLVYTDMAISETLRKYPIGTVLLRECTQNYQIPDSSFEIERGTRILIPVYALHHDSKYFPDPERFDPERFSVENKDKIVPGTYLPFGDGPRVCIGLRFALMEMKYAFCKIIPKYEFTLSEETPYPIQFKKGVPLLAPENGVWLKISEIH